MSECWLKGLTMQKNQPEMRKIKVVYRDEEKLSQAVQDSRRSRKSRADMSKKKKAMKLGNAVLSNCLRLQQKPRIQRS